MSSPPRHVPDAACRPLHAFARDRRGGVALVFAFAIVVVLGLVGAAIDYARASSVRTDLNVAADAAALAAAREAQAAESRGEPVSVAERKAKAVGEAVFQAAVARLKVYESQDQEIRVDLSAEPATARVRYSGKMPTTIMQVLQQGVMRIGGEAVAAFDVNRPLDIHIFLDTSASMKLGATSGDIERLKTSARCAFACHDGNRRAELGDRDSFEWALANSVQLRFQAINAGVIALLDHLKRQDPQGTKIRVALYGFAEGITPLADLSSNFDALKGSLPRVPAGQTHLNRLIPDMANIVGNVNEGSRATRKLVLLATDGAENAGRNWTTNIPERVKVGSVDGSNCRRFKNKVQVAVLHTPYLPMPWDWGYEATLGQPSQLGGPSKRVDDMAPQLRACATDGLYINAFEAGAIREAGVKLYQAATGLRITH